MDSNQEEEIINPKLELSEIITLTATIIEKIKHENPGITNGKAFDKAIEYIIKNK